MTRTAAAFVPQIPVAWAGLRRFCGAQARTSASAAARRGRETYTFSDGDRACRADATFLHLLDRHGTQPCSATIPIQVRTHRSLVDLAYRLVDAAAIIAAAAARRRRYTDGEQLPSLAVVGATTLLVHLVAIEVSGLYRNWRGSRLSFELWCVADQLDLHGPRRARHRPAHAVQRRVQLRHQARLAHAHAGGDGQRPHRAAHGAAQPAQARLQHAQVRHLRRQQARRATRPQRSELARAGPAVRRLLRRPPRAPHRGIGRRRAARTPATCTQLVAAGQDRRRRHDLHHLPDAGRGAHPRTTCASSATRPRRSTSCPTSSCSRCCTPAGTRSTACRW